MLFPFFLNKSAAYLTRRGFLLDTVLNDEAAVGGAVERLKRSLAREPFNPRRCIDKPEESAIAARLALYIAAATKNSYILKRFADAESKLFTDLLRKIPGVQNPRCKIEIARDLGVDARPAHEVVSGIVVAAYNTPIAVRWTSYLRFSSFSSQRSAVFLFTQRLGGLPDDFGDGFSELLAPSSKLVSGGSDLPYVSVAHLIHLCSDARMP
jgi:DNA primase large subunit